MANTTTCPACGVAASGRFCAECGTPLGDTTCASCHAQLSAGAKFCHRCGTPVGERAPRPVGERGLAGAMPWAVAAISLLALVALVAGQRFARSRPAEQQSVAAADASGGMPAAGGANVDQSPVRAPDISNLTPEEQAERLFNRVMTLFEQGDTARVQFLAPMAVEAYQRLPKKSLDDRYHLGRIGAVTGVANLAGAQADTILQQRPTHLLGLILAAQGARMRGDEGVARGYDRRLLAALPAERKAALPEYAQHENDITRAVEGARSRGQ
ncbi:MAG: zinc ribbon domain-containing protein [Gemmatimonadaceae bacterium]|nr:zinc ribbon domain-containing protein [Gemmatimonadaceae bacterium]NUQ94858.1 zinc ribbon domain-containing protein [Gemmatimonadaceae bacterium]